MRRETLDYEVRITSVVEPPSTSTISGLTLEGGHKLVVIPGKSEELS
ncbi:MAG: hypothetical protein OK457_00055 [Thaumarchaeota archaeon]|nr:hypothetical protein [Nitrososphaerota archaeon]